MGMLRFSLIHFGPCGQHRLGSVIHKGQGLRVRMAPRIQIKKLTLFYS